jgi:hypothetical protein
MSCCRDACRRRPLRRGGAVGARSFEEFFWAAAPLGWWPQAVDRVNIAAAVDTAEDTHYIEDIPRLYCARTTLPDRRDRGTEDKAAGQCRGDLGVSVDSLTTLSTR